MSTKIGLRGKYRLTVLDASRNVVRQTDWFWNLITDIGLDRIGVSGSVGTFCRIGTGTATPLTSDTALQSQVASTSSLSAGGTGTVTNAGSPDYETTASLTYEFALGAVVGNMAEVGVGWTASTASTLFSRARILDGVGSPTAITVLATEILQVTYAITYYPQLTDSVGTVSVSGVTYNYTARASTVASVAGALPNGAIFSSVLSASAYGGPIGAITGVPSGTQSALTVGSFQSYSNGTYYRDFTSSAAISVGNISGGIRSILLNVGGGGSTVRTQIEFSPVIPKTSSTVLNMTFRVAWARH